MWGATIGEQAGSIYEYAQFKKWKLLTIKHELLTQDSFYGDDTIQTVAILEAILEGLDYAESLRRYGREYANYKPSFEPTFTRPFSPGFMKWVREDTIGHSTGNGAMMRISPVGYLFNTEDEVIRQARLATIPTHDFKEAIECATIIARVIYFARNKCKKEEILERLNIRLKYEPFLKFNTTCYETIENSLFATFTSQSFEESLYKILSYGGDTDTNACIVGSMAEALYGVPFSLIETAQKNIPPSFVKKIQTGYSKIKN